MPGWTFAEGVYLLVCGVVLCAQNGIEIGVGSIDLADLLRCIFGNPFRPATIDPTWFTSPAVALAASMYESRDFAPMPILADALQDAGCENADVLAHCRNAQAPHVRGCWVVDLVLGKG